MLHLRPRSENGFICYLFNPSYRREALSMSVQSRVAVLRGAGPSVSVCTHRGGPMGTGRSVPTAPRDRLYDRLRW